MLDNGLKVLLHQDVSSTLATVNLLYDVGSRDEDPNKTGFAHLFEHLMFGGTKNIPNYDQILQDVGATNNAFTNPNITNYYVMIPSSNLETALWVEADRMRNLSLSNKSLEVQRGVVIEEFKQRYLNQPYGDIWLHLRPVVYEIHPYRWPTIGKCIEHIEEADLSDVEKFYNHYYRPNNAILSIAGNINIDETKMLVEKWFSGLEKVEFQKRNLPVEPNQISARSLEINADVPGNAFYKCWHMCDRTAPDYYASDLISDILGRGESSRLFQNLVKKSPLFTEIGAYVSGDLDPGLLIVSGKLNDGVSFNEAEQAINNEINALLNFSEEKELEKVKNKVISTDRFSALNNMNKAMNMSFYELIGDYNLINSEVDKYRQISIQEIQKVAGKLLVENNSTTLRYKKM